MTGSKGSTHWTSGTVNEYGETVGSAHPLQALPIKKILENFSQVVLFVVTKVNEMK